MGGSLARLGQVGVRRSASGTPSPSTPSTNSTRLGRAMASAREAVAAPGPVVRVKTLYAESPEAARNVPGGTAQGLSASTSSRSSAASAASTRSSRRRPWHRRPGPGTPRDVVLPPPAPGRRRPGRRAARPASRRALRAGRRGRPGSPGGTTAGWRRCRPRAPGRRRTAGSAPPSSSASTAARARAVVGDTQIMAEPHDVWARAEVPRSPCRRTQRPRGRWPATAPACPTRGSGSRGCWRPGRAPSVVGVARRVVPTPGLVSAAAAVVRPVPAAHAAGVARARDRRRAAPRPGRVAAGVALAGPPPWVLGVGVGVAASVALAVALGARAALAPGSGLPPALLSPGSGLPPGSGSGLPPGSGLPSGSGSGLLSGSGLPLPPLLSPALSPPACRRGRGCRRRCWRRRRRPVPGRGAPNLTGRVSAR